jgi:hypothetical protein
MRFFIAGLVSYVLLAGCTSTRSNVPPASAAREPLKTVSTIPLATVETHRMPLFGGGCPLFFPPHEVGSVMRIPAPMMSTAMDPVMNALCACTKPGEYAVIVAQIDFGAGTTQLKGPESPQINECLEMLHVTFTPIPETDMPSSDCIGCGPRYYGVFPDSPAPPKNGLRLMYSFLLDRSNEVLHCPADTHAERGSCKPDVEPAPAPAPKRTCGCGATDLACTIACEGSR